MAKTNPEIDWVTLRSFSPKTHGKTDAEIREMFEAMEASREGDLIDIAEIEELL